MCSLPLCQGKHKITCASMILGIIYYQAIGRRSKNRKTYLNYQVKVLTRLSDTSSELLLERCCSTSILSWILNIGSSNLFFKFIVNYLLFIFGLNILSSSFWGRKHIVKIFFSQRNCDFSPPLPTLYSRAQNPLS